MREKPDSGKESKDQEEPEGKRRLDLSVPQVAGSAIAAVVAAKLASNLGVYGTILGAGVVSGVATCGGTIFQHFFKRTGEQIRVVAVQAKPRAQQVPVARTSSVPDTFKPPETSKISGTSATAGADVTSATPVTFQTAARPAATGPVTTTWGRPRDTEAGTDADTGADETTALPVPGADATTALPVPGDADPTTVLPVPGDADPTTVLPVPGDADPTTVLPSIAAADADAERTRLLGSVDATRALPTDDATRVLRAGAQPGAPGAAAPGTAAMPPLPPDEFTEGTTHRARVRSWKRPLIAAAVVFGVSMAGITTYELVSGKDFSGGDGTTISNLTRNNHTSPKEPSAPADEPTGQPSDGGAPGTGESSPQEDGATRDPEQGGGQTPGTGDGADSGSASKDPGTGSGDTGDSSDSGEDEDTGSGSDDSGTDPTPSTAPTPTPSSGTGTGAGGDAREGATPSP
ncbi:hypothetical protein [Streptomyces sp. NRRL S-1521]|uniref:hypothetical protein n=1 Tax=Streptomyces sp. NRRL S-1521 TaxID=1609100 RepID=UPI00074AFEE3|nr:hypothetical protein [Streptomyces sp. NRRL S-1521]KUL51524.1 hypothetical protein ADL30_27015 [Streptomyces sp. NRRL S-1521]